MSLAISDLMQLLQRHGDTPYGLEVVSQLEHALQCAHLAEQAGEEDETVVAALLHDLCHLIAAEIDRGDPPDAADDLHQYLALPFLRSTFPDAVLEPIRWHVDAKRYLCLIEPSYLDLLSEASRRSLAQQGGVFSESEADAFLAQPYAAEAVRLRRYDDLAKVAGKPVPGLEHYRERLQKIAL